MRLLLLLASLCYFVNVSAQNVEADSLKRLLIHETNDSDRVSLFEGLSYAYLSTDPDTALQYATQGLELATKMNFLKGEAVCINALGNVYFHFGNNAKALEHYFKYLELKEQLKEFHNISIAYYNIASVYTEQKDYANALAFVFKAKKQDEKLKDSSAILYDLYSLGSIYGRMKKNDSALYYSEQCYQLSLRLDDKNMIGSALNILGEIYLATDNVESANKHYNLSIPYVEAINDNEVLTADYFGLAKIYEIKKRFDSSAYYGRKALRIAQEGSFNKQILEISNFMIDLYGDQKKYDSAFYYQTLSITTKDSLFNVEEVKKIENIKFQEQQRQELAAAADQKFHEKIKFYSVIVASAVFLILAIIFWRNNKQKHRANILLAEQKGKVETTLSELKSTQAQLIHSEKMASLGELTAGIAHEIQNPLNFVNNFSEVSNELLHELKSERAKVKTERDEQFEDELLNDISQSLERINHHGKRADAIVKGMLQHSGTSTGQKEETNINALADEYLKLSYHGLRGKDSSFNVTMKTDFDTSIGNIDIVPQDIGRVLLNLYNNAFYAVKEKTASLGSATEKKYEPSVSVTTKRINSTADEGTIEIRVRDNGNGIPPNNIDKIFQPFFTTKPTGQGTGLGLSLSYDIVKAHGGEIKVVSEPGEFTEVTVVLP